MTKQHKATPDPCASCSICVAHCPVAEATSKFKGPKLTGPALERLRINAEDYDPSLDYCSNCKNCDISCPFGVSISTLNMKARAAHYKKHPHPFNHRILTGGEKLGKLSESFPASLTNLSMTIGKKLKLTEIVGISGNAPMPSYADKSLTKRLKNFQQTPYPDKVVFYVGCYIHYNDPEVGMDIIKTLQKNHYEVIIENQFVCCGSPFVSNGYLDEAEKNAKKNISVAEKWLKKNYPIITGCTSCLLMLKQEYQELFPDLADKAAKIAPKIYDTSEFLLSLHEKNKLNLKLGKVSGKYIYHAPCHLRAQGIGLPALDLLALIPDLQIENAAAGCCGISGSYGIKSDKNEISEKVGSKLFKRIKSSQASTVLSECGTCRLQIHHGTQVVTKHPITVLREAYDNFVNK